MTYNERYVGLQHPPPKRRAMTLGDIHSPSYPNLQHLAWALQLEKNRILRTPGSHSYSPESVLRAAERVTGRSWREHRGSRRSVSVALREQLVAALRDMSLASYPDIAKLLGGVHSAAHMAHHRYLRRPVKERQTFLASVRATLDRI